MIGIIRGKVLPALFSVFFFAAFFCLTPVFAININLAWDANTESNLAGYRVYYGAASRTYGTPVNVGNVTSYTVTGLSAGTYYFAVTAVDTNGNESVFSTEVLTNLNCAYAIAPTTVTVGQGAGTGSVAVTSSTGCNWTATSNASWITITSGSGGTGDGTVNYSLAVNSSGVSRTGTLTIAGQAFTVTQSGITCIYAISSASQSFGVAGGTGDLTVTSTSGCNWTAVSNVPWVSITAGGIGIGNGPVNYSVSTNTGGASRSGTLTIAGQTFTVIQAGLICSYSISPPTQSLTDSAGTGSVTVTTSSGCNWTASSNATWLTVTSGASGTGNGTVNFSAAANTTGSSRSGTLTVAGRLFTVTQSAVACSYSISPTNRPFDESGGTGSVAVTGTSGCNWTASSNASWLTITTVIFGTNGLVNYSVAANTTTGSRTGSLTIAGQTFTVTQAGISCSYSIAPTSQSFAESGGTGSVTMTSASGCGWTAVSNDGWLSITSGSSGTGNGTVDFSAAVNTSISSRTGTLTIGGQTFSVTQSGISCNYSILPASQSFSDSGGTGIVTVNAPGVCSWSAASSDAWLTITSGSSGTGNGSVNYSVAANTTITTRTGTLVIAGQTLVVTQTGISCSYSISPGSQSLNDGAGAGSVTVTSPAGCAWTATSNDGWLSISSSGSGSGSGSVNYLVAANTTISTRTGTLSIAGQTFTVTQTGIPCTYSLSPTSDSFSDAATTGNVAVTAVTGCTWTASSNAGWLTINLGSSGTGSGTVNYSVAANTTITPRTGTLTIAGQTLTVTQAGIPCTYSIAPARQSFNESVGTGSVTLTSPTGCAWTASSNDGWLTITSAGSGTGSAPVTYSVDANTTINTRTGTLNIAGQTFTVTQAGITCTYFVSPTSQSFNDSGGPGTFAVTATSGCAWTASSNQSWLTVTSGGSGIGNGTVNYSVAANPTINSRTGILTVSGQTLTVTQAGAGCTYSISPTSQSFGDAAGTGSVSVTTLAGCTWTTSSNANWLTITTVIFGTTGLVNYSVAANTSSISRTGTLTIAGQTFTVTQAGVGCTYTIFPATQSVSGTAGTGSVTVSSPSGCGWTATSNAGWLTVSSEGTGTGNGTVNYLVAANTSTTPRTGTLTIAGQIHTVTQAGISCTYTISPTSQSFSDGAGTGSVTVTSPGGCAWTASSNASWITIVAGASGTGNGSVNYSVAANTATSSRTGTLTIAGQPFNVTQAGISCTYSISPTSLSVPAGGVTGTLTVTTAAGCAWTPTSNASWLTITSAGSGTGNGSVDYSVAANSTTSSRTGTITIAGRDFIVTQAGAGCTYSLSPPSQFFSDPAGTGTVVVTATSGCSWTAESNVSWLSITSGATGTGNGNVNYLVAANMSSSSRTGILTIAGQTLTVTQAASSCTYSLTPTSQTFSNSAGTGAVTVSAPSACNWTAASNASWLAITSGASGSGNGTVTYSIAANETGARSGTLTIAGQTFTVTQTDVTCVSAVLPTTQSYSDIGGTGTVAVSGAPGCSWRAAANVGWITVPFVELPGGTSGGSGTVHYVVAANTTTSFRTGTLTIGGRTFTVNQSGLGCTSSISPSSQSFDENGGTGTVSLTVTGPCSTAPTSNASWISLTSVILPGSSAGGGNGLISYSVAPNPTTNSRTGTVSVAGQTFIVRQASSGCVYSVFPDSQSFSKSAGTGSIAVIAPSGCAWTAVSTESWITILLAGSGSGNGVVDYSVEAAGPTIVSRSAVLTIAGQTVTVTQSGTHANSFSQFANGADWSSSLVLTNPSPTEVATGTVTFYKSTGEPATLSINGQAPATNVPFTIEPLGGATLTTDGAGDLVAGSVQVRSNTPMAGVVKYSHRTLGMTGVGESAPLRSLMTFVVADAIRNTGVALSNTQPGTAQLSLSLRGLDGREVAGGSSNLTIPPNGQTAKFIHELFPAANTANFQGTLVVTATSPESRVIATSIQIGTSAGQFASMPVVSVDPASRTRQLFFAHFVNGGTWASKIYVVNPSGSSSSAASSFLDVNGNLLAISGPGGVTLDSQISDIQPLGGAVLQSDGLGPQRVGSARLIANHPLGGVLVFASPGVGTAGVAASTPMTRFITPMSRNADKGLSTGVAIASVGSAVRLQLELRTQRGAPVPFGQVTLNLPANGHLARFLEQLFPGADTSNFEGTLSVFAEGGTIVATALQLGAVQDQLAALPVTAVR